MLGKSLQPNGQTTLSRPITDRNRELSSFQNWTLLAQHQPVTHSLLEIDSSFSRVVFQTFPEVGGDFKVEN